MFLRLGLLILSLISLSLQKVRCPCGWAGAEYDPMFPGCTDRIRCPRCLSVDRQRLYRLFLEEMSPHPESCLHVSPETIVMDYLRPRSRFFMSTGLPPEIAMRREDLTCLSFYDEVFDFIFCAHVLEHIPNDRAAMKELYRVLAPGGIAILQVPLTQKPHTYEDPTIIDPEARKKAFGQDDHVRKYGQDFLQKLTDIGFTVDVHRYFDTLPKCVQKAYGLYSEDVYVCSKKRRI